MTKCVRIENADTSAYKVVVQVWNKSLDPNVPDILEQEHRLDHPTFLKECYIHSGNYLLIKEVE